MENLRDKFKNIDEDQFVSEPLDGHAHRFETKLMRQNYQLKDKKRNHRMWFALLAAASFIGFVIFITLRQPEIDQPNYADNTQEKYPADFANYSPEAGLKQDYFQKLLKEKAELELPEDDPDLKAMIMTLRQLETEYEILNEKLSQNFHNEHLINAVLDNYKLRLEILEKIQKFIYLKNRIKNQSHEKEFS